MSDKQRIVIRADGNQRVGLGHVVRSLALAEMLQSDYAVVFAIQEPEEDLLHKIRQTCSGVIPLPATLDYQTEALQLVEKHLKPADVVVLDGYSFNTDYQRTVKDFGCSLLCIDDINAFPFVADAVVNMAGGLELDIYQLAPYTKLFTGPDYALLRKPFRKAALQHRTMPPKPVRLLLCLGGSDQHNYTLRLARETAEMAGIKHVEIVVGSAYSHLQELTHWLQDRPHCSLHQNAAAEELCRIMQECQVALTSASGVAYEYGAVGGILFVLKTAANQNGFYRFLLQDRLAFSYEQMPQVLAEHNLEELYNRQLARQRKYFNGESKELYLRIFETLSLGACLTIREVTEQDMLLLFEWSNDPEVRSRSFSSAPIPLNIHQHWFSAKLANPDSCLYIAEAAGRPVAHIRFEIKKNSAIISYLIGPGFRGKGLGHVVLLKGINFLKEQRPEVTETEGLVQADNRASVRAFEKAGFSCAAPDPAHPEAHRFLLPMP